MVDMKGRGKEGWFFSFRMDLIFVGMFLSQCCVVIFICSYDFLNQELFQLHIRAAVMMLGQKGTGITVKFKCL